MLVFIEGGLKKRSKSLRFRMICRRKSLFFEFPPILFYSYLKNVGGNCIFRNFLLHLLFLMSFYAALGNSTVWQNSGTEPLVMQKNTLLVQLFDVFPGNKRKINHFAGLHMHVALAEIKSKAKNMIEIIIAACQINVFIAIKKLGLKGTNVNTGFFKNLTLDCLNRSFTCKNAATRNFPLSGCPFFVKGAARDKNFSLSILQHA